VEITEIAGVHGEPVYMLIMRKGRQKLKRLKDRSFFEQDSQDLQDYEKD
jgi:hypothetical protein